MQTVGEVPDPELLAPPPRRVVRVRGRATVKLVFGLFFLLATSALCGGAVVSEFHGYCSWVARGEHRDTSLWWVGTLLVAAIYLVGGGFGALCFVDALLGWARERRLCREGVAVCGEVLEQRGWRSGRPSGRQEYHRYYTLTIRFRDTTGAERTETPPIFTQDAAAFAPGCKVSILLDPQDPGCWILYATADYQVA